MADNSALFNSPYFNLSINFDGVEAISHIEADYRKAALKEMRSAVNQVLDVTYRLLIEELNQYHATGQTAKSIRINRPSSNSYIAVSGSIDSDYIGMNILEFGRAPDQKGPPVDDEHFSEWIDAVGFDGSPFILAKTIGERGLEAKEPWEKVYARVGPLADPILDHALDNIMASL